MNDRLLPEEVEDMEEVSVVCDSDGTATAAVCEDIPVPEGLPSAAIAQTKSVNP
jgi:hypothetical protein